MKKILLKILVILIICLCIFSFIFTNPIFTNDELWNFQNLYKLYNGYVLYEDINAITPPLFYYLGYIILSIFSFSIVGVRAYNILIYIAFLYVTFKVFKALNVSNTFLPLYLTFIVLLLTQNILAGANYTILAFLFFIFGMYLYLSKRSNNVLQGIIIYLCIFTKQNIGFFYVLSVLIYELISNKKFNLYYIKNQSLKFLVFLIPTSITLIHMYFTGNLKMFLNYCVGGLFEFGNLNVNISFPSLQITIVLFSIFVYILSRIFKNKNKTVLTPEFLEKMDILFIFFIGTLLNVYPIFNSTHFIYTMPFASIIIFYFFDTILFKKIFDTLNAIKFSITLSLLIILLITFRNFVILYLNIDNYHYYNDISTPYNHMFIDTKLYEKNEKIKNFILENESNGKTVKILSYEAALPMIELKKSNGKYDLFFIGNLGYNGISTAITEIKNSKNTIYLLFSDDDDLFFQDSIEIREFIMENLEFKGTISNYSIYENN